VTFGDSSFTANIPIAVANVFDRNTGRMLHGQSQNLRAPEEELADIRAEHGGGLHIDGDLGRPDPRWLALEPETAEEAFSVLAQRLHADGMVADWHHDPDHALNPTNRRVSCMYRFPPVEGWESEAAAGDAVPEVARSFLSARILIGGAIGVIVVGALLALLLLGSGSDDEGGDAAALGAATAALAAVTDVPADSGAPPLAAVAVAVELLGSFVFVGDGVIEFAIVCDRIIGTVVKFPLSSGIQLVGQNAQCQESASQTKAFDLDINGVGQ